MINDDGKIDYREREKLGVRDIRGNEIPPDERKRLQSREESTPEDTKRGHLVEFWKGAGYLEENAVVLKPALVEDNTVVYADGPPDFIEILAMRDSKLYRDMGTGGFLVTGPLLASPEPFEAGEMFEALELFDGNARRSAHNQEQAAIKESRQVRMMP